MRCPYCVSDSTRVVDSRLTEPGDAVRRRRQCPVCGARFTTYERAGAVALVVLKRDRRREPFDQRKLMDGLLRAATKRPVALEALERLIERIAAAVRQSGGELSAQRIGELALQGLIELDRVAAIRFASVYRNFEDIGEFEAELRRLEAESEKAGTDPSDSSASMGGSANTGTPPAPTHSFG